MRSSPGLPSYSVAGAAAGAGCARAPPVSHGDSLEGFRLLRCLPRRAVRTWKTWRFSFALVSLSSLWRMVLPVEFSVLVFLGDPACNSLGSTVDTWSSRGFGQISTFFYVAVNSNPEAFGLHSCRMEKRTQSMLLVAASLSAVRTLEVDIISTSAPFLTVCGNFAASCIISLASMMENSSSFRAHANWTVMLCQHRDRISFIVTKTTTTTRPNHHNCNCSRSHKHNHRDKRSHNRNHNHQHQHHHTPNTTTTTPPLPSPLPPLSAAPPQPPPQPQPNHQPFRLAHRSTVCVNCA